MSITMYMTDRAAVCTAAPIGCYIKAKFAATEGQQRISAIQCPRGRLCAEHHRLQHLATFSGAHACYMPLFMWTTTIAHLQRHHSISTAACHYHCVTSPFAGRERRKGTRRSQV